MEFAGGIKEIACEISRGLCFWPWNWDLTVTQFCGISRG